MAETFPAQLAVKPVPVILEAAAAVGASTQVVVVPLKGLAVRLYTGPAQVAL